MQSMRYWRRVMTARARKKPLLVMPPLACQVPACDQEYAPIGDYADTDRAALLGGWIYRAGQWLCAAHRDHIPWWPGARLALPQREPGATRAEFLGVVARAALPPPDVPLPADEQHMPVETPGAAGQGHTESRIGGTLREGMSGQPLLQEPAGGASPSDALPVPPPAGGPRPEERQAGPSDHLEPSPAEPQPGGTIYPQLTEEALAGAVPLGQLAPEPQEDEAQT